MDRIAEACVACGAVPSIRALKDMMPSGAAAFEESNAAFTKAYDHLLRTEFGLKTQAEVQVVGNLTYYTIYDRMQKAAKKRAHPDNEDNEVA
jgi:hypothetical protein